MSDQPIDAAVYGFPPGLSQPALRALLERYRYQNPPYPVSLDALDEFYAQTQVGGKWLCVVVKYPPDDGFVVTAYLTDQLKAGDTIWPTK